MISTGKFRNFKKQADIIFKTRLLADFTPAERYEFLQLCHNRKYKSSEFIFHQGDPGTGLYILEDGLIELTLDTGEFDVIPSRHLHPTQCIGTLAVISESRRYCSAHCVTDSRLLGFFRPDYELLRNRQPRIAIKLMEAIANNLVLKLSHALVELSERADSKTLFDIQAGLPTNEAL